MKHILITGVSTGIGRHAADHFASNGWKVFGSVRSLDDVAGLVTQHGSRFVPVVMDVTQPDQVDQAARQVAGILAGSKLDVLVNNAGIATFGPLIHVPLEVFDYQLRVNVHG
ncbi:MAG: SDR family NAD(P)-dependent oxidoreductase, partial [Saprospiraceae bacterium]|nr:SDR family NAD(P)-dependent oxidoreductase [Saprospiraceae bacterium]